MNLSRRQFGLSAVLLMAVTSTLGRFYGEPTLEGLSGRLKGQEGIIEVRTNESGSIGGGGSSWIKYEYFRVASDGTLTLIQDGVW